MSGTYEMIADTITGGNYDLSYMIGVIDRFWMEGAIDVSEREELKEMARNGAIPADSYATNEQRILALENALRELTDRVTALESGGTTPVDPGDDWPEWVQPTGAFDAYPMGAHITFNGKRYESIIDNNVWSPSVYPAGWREVE